MKKILAIALAAALVLSLSTVVFAAGDVYSTEFIDRAGEGYRKVSSDNNWVATPLNPVVNYGNTVYYRLTGATYANGDSSAVTYGPVTQDSAVAGLRIFDDWSVGEEWVTKTELVKKRYQATGNYEYFLAVSFKPVNTATSVADVVGEVYLKATVWENRPNRNNVTGGDLCETNTLSVVIELNYAPPAAVSAPNAVFYAMTPVITESARKFSFKDNGWDKESFDLTFSTWGDAATFTVNTVGQGDLILQATNDYNTAVGNMFPNANLNFFNGNGASFNNIGKMLIPADVGSHIYELKNGSIIPVFGASYLLCDSGFYFDTRTLGSYIVSDVPLALGAVNALTPVGSGNLVAVNPSTGAAG